MQPNRPPHRHNQAQAEQTWENTSLIPFLRAYYPSADVEGELAEVQRFFATLRSYEQNPGAVHQLVQDITDPRPNAFGQVQRAYPNTQDRSGDLNRILVTLVLLRHGQQGAPIWLPPRPPGLAAQQARAAGPVQYPRWTQQSAINLQPPPPNPNWTGYPAAGGGLGPPGHNPSSPFESGGYGRGGSSHGGHGRGGVPPRGSGYGGQRGGGGGGGRGRGGFYDGADEPDG